MKRWKLPAIFVMWGVAMLMNDAAAQVRHPAVAGQFYPQDPLQLAREVHRLLENADDLGLTDVVGLVVPHAGYVYSAATAAAGYKQAARQEVELAVVIAPSHRDYFSGVTIYPGDAYETPLGRIPIDKETAQTLAAADKNVHLSVAGHRTEHALEVQLPFIQVLFPRARLLPMVVGVDCNWKVCESVGQSLAEAVRGKKALLIASSDLYHGESYRECVRISCETLSVMARLLPEELFRGLQEGRCQACGGLPAVIMEYAARLLGAKEAVIAAQTNSNDVTGTRGGYVVGYGAVVVSGKRSESSPRREFEPLTLEEQKTLLKLARQTLVDHFKGKRSGAIADAGGHLNEHRGVFVTLTQNGALRGCIGRHEADVPLIRLVPEMTLAAAFEDPRFEPLRAEELDRTKIKISVYLTNVYRIHDLSEFKMGEHGIILKKGGRAATYLPEVPLEAGWKTVEEEMVSLCRKAGLAPDAWKSGAEFWVYKTQVFDESLLKK